MRTPIILALATILSLAGCNTDTVTSTGGAIKLGANPLLSGGTYSSGGGITIASELRNIGGMTGICGAWSESEVQSELTDRSAGPIMQSGLVSLGKERLHQNLIFMRKVSPLANYAGVEANCIRTKRPWQAGDETRAHSVRIPSQVAYRDRSGGGGSIIIMFNPGKPGALSQSLANFGIALQDTETRNLSASPGLAGGSYSSGGGLTIAAELREIDGIGFVCGVWAESKTQSDLTKGQAARVLSSGAVILNGRVLIKDLLFMRQTRPARSYSRQSARCASTGLPYNPGDDRRPLSISLPAQTVYEGSAGVIRFTPTGPGA